MTAEEEIMTEVVVLDMDPRRGWYARLAQDDDRDAYEMYRIPQTLWSAYDKAFRDAGVLYKEIRKYPPVREAER